MSFKDQDQEKEKNNEKEKNKEKPADAAGPLAGPDVVDRNVRRYAPVVSPRSLAESVSASPAALRTVAAGREGITRLISGTGDRLLVIVGPCSVHDPVAAMDYAARLSRLGRELSGSLLVVMRVYFEKPRTTVGWKGLINDPRVDGTEDIEAGLETARRVLLAVAELGLPAACEFLDPVVPQYISDLVSWAAVGARTTESQTHREMASGLSMPVGFKNSTDGNVSAAVNAMASAASAHSFFGIDHDGRLSVVRTTGNPDVHVVLRGSDRGPNYSPSDVAAAAAAIDGAVGNVGNGEEGGEGGGRRDVMIDCSHGNSGKKHTAQAAALRSVLAQVAAARAGGAGGGSVGGGGRILGVMLESNIFPGSQKTGGELRYGVSITDACIGWEETEELLRECAARLGDRKKG